MARIAFIMFLICISLGVGMFVLHSRSDRELDDRSAESNIATPLIFREQPAVSSPIRFVSVPVSESGVDFVYYGSPSTENFMTEQNGGGVALFDADGDGRLDLFLVNGSHFRHSAESVGAGNRLYWQSGPWRFVDVTSASGLEAFGFGQGCAAGDFDNDGFCDLFVACYGANRLWHNNGDGTFSEVTNASGVGDELWGTSAAFADLDGDGNPDLHVVNYVNWSPDGKDGPRIPSPMEYEGQPDLLYLNQGDGTFREIGADAGIAIEKVGKGLAVAAADLDGDLLPDLYVANDTTRNFLFKNLGGMRFEEIGVISGCAFSQDGSIGSSMGIAVEDYNRDGQPDLFVTNFAGELLDVFTGIGSAGFVASNTELGIDVTSRAMLNFGIIVADFDADRYPDLFFANGHLWDDTAAGGEYRMRPNLLRNELGTRFVDVSDSAGDYFLDRWLGRAVAMGDVDNDGDADLVVSHLLDPPALLRNETPRSGHVLRLKLIGIKAARQALGTRVEAVVNGESCSAHVPSGGSFQASHDDRVLIATGEATVVDELRVYWRPGHVQVWENVPVGGLIWLVEGQPAIVRRDTSAAQ